MNLEEHIKYDSNHIGNMRIRQNCTLHAVEKDRSKNGKELKQKNDAAGDIERIRQFHCQQVSSAVTTAQLFQRSAVGDERSNGTSRKSRSIAVDRFYCSITD